MSFICRILHSAPKSISFSPLIRRTRPNFSDGSRTRKLNQKGGKMRWIEKKRVNLYSLSCNSNKIRYAKRLARNELILELIASGQSCITSSRRDKRVFNYVQLFKSTLDYSSLIRKRNYINLNGTFGSKSTSCKWIHFYVDDDDNDGDGGAMIKCDLGAAPLTVAVFRPTFTITSSHNDLQNQTKSTTADVEN